MIKMIISQIMDIDEDKKRVENRRDTFKESLLRRWWLYRHMKTFKFFCCFFTAFSEDIIDNVMQYVLYAGDKQ